MTKIKIFKTDNFQIRYADYGNSSKPLVLIFPAGIGNIDKHCELAEVLSKNFHVLHFESPGAGESYSYEKNLDYAKVAGYFYASLKGMNLNNIRIFGESYGGFVAMEFIKLAPARKLVLQGFGDMFTQAESHLYRLMYLPFKVSKHLRFGYIYALKRLKVTDVRSFNQISQDNVMDRWWNFLKTNLKTDRKVDFPVLIINSKWDFVIRPRSYNKFKKIFSNYKLHLTRNSHYHYKKELLKNNFKVIVDFLQD